MSDQINWMDRLREWLKERPRTTPSVRDTSGVFTPEEYRRFDEQFRRLANDLKEKRDH